MQRVKNLGPLLLLGRLFGRNTWSPERLDCPGARLSATAATAAAWTTTALLGLWSYFFQDFVELL